MILDLIFLNISGFLIEFLRVSDKLLRKGNRTEKIFFAFLFHIVANKRPYLHYTSSYQLLVFTDDQAITGVT